MIFKRLFIFLIFSIIFIPGAVFAQNASDSAQNADDKKTRQIEDLKERLATKVAELKETKPAAVIGKITNLTLTTLSVETKTKEIKIELTDGIKIFSTIKGKKTALDIEDLTKGDLVSVIGEYDSTLDVLKALVIYVEEEQPQVFFGIIADTDSDDYTITLKTDTGKNYVIDYEKTTKTYEWKDNEKAKAGFSKLNPGHTVAVSGFILAKDENRISAGRILSLGVIDGAGTTSEASKSAEKSE